MDSDNERHLSASLPPKWQYYYFPLAAKLWGISTSPTQRYQKNRLIFDKLFHQGNMAKKLKNISEVGLASKCPFCPSTDSASHWSGKCVAIPRSVEIWKIAIQFIKELIVSVVAEQSEQDFKVALRHLGDDYLSFLVGDRKSADVLRGLWTADQLSYFGTNEHYSP